MKGTKREKSGERIRKRTKEASREVSELLVLEFNF